MRRALLAPALVGALLAAPARAADDGLKLSGEGEFIASYLHLGDKQDVIQADEANDIWTLGAGATLDGALGSWHLQTDFSGEGNLNSRSASDTYLGSFGGGLHAGWRDPELGSLGAFGTVGNVRIHANGERDPRTLLWGVGLEGQLFFDPATLYVQTGYLDREAVEDGGDKAGMKNTGFVRLLGRYFIGDDFKIQAEGSYAQGRMDPDSDNLFIGGWGAELEYRLANLPVSGFLKYSGAYFFQDDDVDKMWENRIGFGVRVYFGQPSLKANDRHGASLDLPRYLQWDGLAAGTLE